MSSVKERLLTAVFPQRCDLCGEVCAFDKIRCEACRLAERIRGDICLRCGREKENCVCKKERFSPKYRAFCAPYYFEGSMVSAVYRLKNDGFSELAAPMGKEIAACVKERFPDAAFDCVSFIPMTAKRERERGYNQSELLARVLAEELQLDCEALLVKIMDTPSQRTSSAAERKANLYGAFDAREDASIDGRTVLLVDDVKTTGATLSECAAVLKAYGAKDVFACAFTVTNKKQ